MHVGWSLKPSTQVLSVLIMSLLVVLVVSQTPVSAIDPNPSNLNVGPYVDRLIYQVIPNQDQRVLALQSGGIEMDTSYFDSFHLQTLSEDPEIDIFEPIRYGYGHISINCRDYPLNISGFRRAFAFAFDKTEVTTEIWNGFSLEHDSLVPYPDYLCIEDEFDWHYYTNQADIGNQILDDLGFEINVTSGYRLAPNGEPFDITILYSSSSIEIAGGSAQIGVDALHALHIDAEKDFFPNEYPDRISVHGNYDMYFSTSNFYDAVDYLANEFWSENANEFGENPTNFVNATYDSWRNQLLYGTTIEDVFDAAAEMQKILHYNVPQLVVYENTYLQAYRNDTFTGHVEELGGTIAGKWTMRKIHPIVSPFGGDVPIAIYENPDSFNIFVTHSPSSNAILMNLYSTLYKQGPNLYPWPDLATNMLTETHDDNAVIPDGHMRFTIDIIHNATWSDGEPLTADDIVFTFMYQLETIVYENPAGQNLVNLYAVYAPNPYRVVFQFSTESFWHFNKFAYDYIIPEHIFNDDTGIGYEGWNTWNPVYSSGPHVTSGPFRLTDYIEWDDTFVLTRNSQYYYLDPDTPPVGNSHNPEPIIHSSSDVSYIVGTTGNEIVWEVSDDNPLSYRICNNSIPCYNGPWHGSDIIYNIDGLDIGSYEFTLDLYDLSGNVAHNSVRVYVISDLITTPTNDSTLTTIVLVGLASCSTTIMILVVVKLYRLRKYPEDVPVLENE